MFWILCKHAVHNWSNIIHFIPVCGSRYQRPSDFRIQSICKLCKTLETQRGLMKEEKTNSLEYKIKSMQFASFQLVNREDACSRTAYFMRHTALCRMYGIVAYVRHNNHTGSPVLGIPGCTSPLTWIVSAQYAWNQQTYPFLWFKTHGCEKLIGNINVCINKSKDLPTDMPERTTTLFIMTFLY